MTPATAHDIPNQRVDRSIQVTLRPSRLRIDYEVSLSELTLTQDLRGLIGSLPGADRRQWLDQFGRVTGPLNARGFFIAVDRRPVEIAFKDFDLVVEDHPRYIFHLEAAIPPSGRLEIYDTNYATSEGTSRLAIRAREGAQFQGDSLPNEVAEIPIRPVWDMSDEEELRSKRVVVVYKAMGSTAHSIASKSVNPPTGTGLTTEPTPTNPVESRGSGNDFASSRRLRDLLDRGVGGSLPGILLIAAILGSAHSLQPGHGKSLVSAIALRQGARWYHPIILGLATSLTHTGSVLLVAAAIWITGTDRVEGLHVILVRTAGFSIGLAGFWRMGRFLGGHGEHLEATGQHELETPGNLELIGLGVSGGMVPCWDAVGLLVLAAAIGRLSMGILCVVAFGAGMATLLVIVGVLAARVRSTLIVPVASPRLERWLGVGTSLVLATVGLTLFFE